MSNPSIVKIAPFLKYMKQFEDLGFKRQDNWILDFMGKWKKDEKEFMVSVTYHEHRGCQSYLPKPIIEMLGNPKKIKFIVKNNNKIEIETVAD